MTFDVGDSARLTVALAVAGLATDPTTLTLTVKAPDGTEATYSGGQVVQTSTGSYYADVPVTAEGQWKYRWAATGTVVAAEEGSFLVRRRAVS